MSRVPTAAVILALACSQAAAQPRNPPPLHTPRVKLAEGWKIQSSAQVPHGGAEISSAGFDTRGWYPAAVPSTVLATLLAKGLFAADPYFGMNLRSLPGMTYDLGDNFSNVPMQPDSPFAVSWWYRTEFSLPRAARGGRYWLKFDSINYRANVWLNGRLIASADQICGMYRTFEFDITDAAVRGTNALAVEVFAPAEDDLSITFVDWNPLPPDKDMGIVRDVWVGASGPVTVRNAQVVTALNGALDQARLTLYADVKNASDSAVEGTLQGEIEGITVSRDVRLEPGESATVAFTPAEYPQLTLANPRLWWPYGLGPQNLYWLRMQFQTGGAVSDTQDVQFGIREFTSELDAQRHRLFRINGKPIQIRGAGYTHDMLLRVDYEREQNELRYARDMHLNTLRLEGKMLDEQFFDTADRYGIMIMPGWCCCNWWEQWDKWKPEDYVVAAESMRDQIRRLRNHPSVFVFLYGSDVSPNDRAEQVYLKVLQEERWPNPYLSSARDSETAATGLTGVKMPGPYDYVPPNYWFEDTRRGGAFGFNTETSPGHAIPVLESLREMLPASHLWPVDEVWNFHGASPDYPSLDVYTAALESRYGKAKGLEDFVAKSQVMSYEGERAMFEAYRRNQYAATGIIQWMFNNAWPSITWHLYDYFLRPGGGYFGTKKANEPVHVQYSYDDRSVVVVNSLYSGLSGYTVSAKVYNMDLTEMYSASAPADLPENTSTRVFFIPPVPGLSKTYFVRLGLRDRAGALVSSNFYWLSTQPDEVDWDAQKDFRYTPIKTYADLTDLQNLPPARVAVSWTSEQNGSDEVDHVAVRNVSSALAFSIHLTVLKGKDGGDIAPVYWEDNYFELLPGEEREVAVSYPKKLLGGAQPFIRVDGWNVALAGQ